MEDIECKELKISKLDYENGRRLAKSDIQKGLLRLYTLEEIAGYQYYFAKLLKQSNITLCPILNNEVEKIRIMPAYNSIMEEEIGKKFGLHFLDSLKSKTDLPEINKIYVSILGTDTTKKTDKDIGEKIETLYRKEITDSIIFEQFRHYQNWITSPDWRVARDLHIELIYNNSIVDTLDAIVSRKYFFCNLIEFKIGSLTICKYIPPTLSRQLDDILSKIQFKKGQIKL